MSEWREGQRKGGGCSLCKYAGTDTKESSLSPTLTEKAYRELKKSGKEYFCVVQNRPVVSDKGCNCQDFQPDYEPYS